MIAYADAARTLLDQAARWLLAAVRALVGWVFISINTMLPFSQLPEMPAAARDAYRRYGMSKLRREQLLAIIAHHDRKPDAASRAVCAAALQTLRHGCPVERLSRDARRQAGYIPQRSPSQSARTCAPRRPLAPVDRPSTFLPDELAPAGATRRKVYHPNG
jgi:hypothetical protein